MFRLFLAFCSFIHCTLSKISPIIILAYLEFLTENNLSHASIVNHLSALQASFALYNINLSPFQDPRIKYYQKALALHKPFKVTLKKIVDVHTLNLIIQACDTTYMGQVYKAFYLVAFFSLLRISNLVPHSIKSFSPLQQLAQGDIIFAPPVLHMLIKWSKTLQNRNQIKIIKLPSLGSNPLCQLWPLTFSLSSHQTTMTFLSFR